MDINVRFGSGLGEDFDAQRSKEIIVTRTLHSLDCFASTLRNVTVNLRDLNGEKGGVDIECTVAGSFHDGTQFHVRAVTSTFENSLSQALQKAFRVVSKKKKHPIKKASLSEAFA